MFFDTKKQTQFLRLVHKNRGFSDLIVPNSALLAVCVHTCFSPYVMQKFTVPSHQQTCPDGPDLIELQQQLLGLLVIPAVFVINLKTAPLHETEKVMVREGKMSKPQTV